MFKKIVALTLALLLTVLCFGCGGKESGNGTTKASAATSMTVVSTETVLTRLYCPSICRKGVRILVSVKNGKPIR